MIKSIFDEISAVAGDLEKKAILRKYRDNELLKRVLYLCKSKRVKFYIKQIPEQGTKNMKLNDLAFVVSELSHLSNREVTGSDATRFLKGLLESLNENDAYIIERIIDKDPKIGMGTTYINESYKVDKKDLDVIEETPYMGAVSFDEKKAKAVFAKGNQGFSQIKMDGRYCNAIIRNGDVELEARSGEPTIVTGAKFLEELTGFDDCVLNGELTMNGVSRTESNGIIASLIDISSKVDSRTPTETAKKKAEFVKKHGSFELALARIQYTVWDTITIDEYFDKVSKTPYHIRLNNVEVLIDQSKSSMVKLIETRIVNTYGEAMEHFQEVIGTVVDGVPMEGTILKASDGEWKDGKPTWQIKMKLEMDIDLKIVGFNFGTKGSKNEFVVSSFSCESSDGLVKTRPQGLKEKYMAEVTARQSELLGTIIQVKCNGLSHNSVGEYSLMYPAFVCERGDKNSCDTLESIKAIEDAVKALSNI